MKKILFTLATTLACYSVYAQTNTFPASGNVGIGTTSPAATLDVNGNQQLNGSLLFAHDQTAYYIHSAGNGGAIRIRSNVSAADDRNVQFGNIDNNGVWYSAMIVDQNGNIGIGTTTPDAKLAVSGTIHTKEVTVDLTGWPDYVFKPKYTLPSLTDVKTYIDKNQHLPDMPSETEVAKNGINLGEIVKLQTKKIEELTLYLIEKDKQLTDQQAENKQQNTRMAALEAALSKLTTKN